MKSMETLECKYQYLRALELHLLSIADSEQTLGQFNSRYYISFDWGSCQLSFSMLQQVDFSARPKNNFITIHFIHWLLRWPLLS